MMTFLKILLNDNRCSVVSKKCQNLNGTDCRRVNSFIEAIKKCVLTSVEKISKKRFLILWSSLSWYFLFSQRCCPGHSKRNSGRRATDKCSTYHARRTLQSQFNSPSTEDTPCRRRPEGARYCVPRGGPRPPRRRPSSPTSWPSTTSLASRGRLSRYERTYSIYSNLSAV